MNDKINPAQAGTQTHGTHDDKNKTATMTPPANQPGNPQQKPSAAPSTAPSDVKPVPKV